ncbi:tetratricopeptide repeat protein [Desulfohalobiaceae bacterium Ax17]|uniref:tetratricopeptide repeat protein n=1 Tax=Desulfovulcanus ferrireducens TaxID=2831190 RepID=UPI00207BC708|nr:tetratricopeptide repeat protein [Desulfovulcanus ferrireducens]MBT8764012.1 tetratricopeptide repeat protein [Desulfovulcanus ferrireducens]
MQDKIDFYEEVLALDPHSKLFFPLARLYLESKQTQKALEVLQAGLEKYPEHLEARLLLANIYFWQGLEEQGEKICVEIFELLKKNSFFWTTLEHFWARKSQEDLALAFKFIAEHAQGQELTWSSVLKAGLLALEKRPEVNAKGLTEGEGVENRSEQETLTSSPKSIQERVSTSAKDLSLEHEQLSEQETDDKGPEGAQAEEIFARTGTYQDGTRAVVAVDKEPDGEFEEVEEVEELNFEEEARTRSLADLLFEQEEYVKALDIYEELWRSSLPGTERKEIEERIKEIKELLASQENRPEQEVSGETAGSEEASSGENIEQAEVVDFLSSLAERLEARAEKQS